MLVRWFATATPARFQPSSTEPSIVKTASTTAIVAIHPTVPGVIEAIFQAPSLTPRLYSRRCVAAQYQCARTAPFNPPHFAQMQGQGSGGGAAAPPAVMAVDELEKMVESLLSFARAEIQSDRPNEALNAVVHAIRLSRGEEGIAAVLVEARKRSEAAHESKRMERAIAEANQISRALMREKSLLAEQGLQDFLKDAFMDGSSVVCHLCGQLISRERWTSHSQMWCPNLPESD